MKMLTVIMAHGDRKAQETFDRHLPFWIANGYNLMVVCPEDCPVKTSLQTVLIGKRSHHSEEANRRFRVMLETILKTDNDWFLIHEYDSICLEPMMHLSLKTGLWSNLFTADQPDFTGHHFTHPPLFMDRDTLAKLLAHTPEVPDSAEQGFWDRWLGLLGEVSGITFRDYSIHGYSQNTIEPRHYAEAALASKRGAIMFHGVKTEEALYAILEGRHIPEVAVK